MGNYSKRFLRNFNYKKTQTFISKLVDFNVNCQMNRKISF
jgi:hypothetical protein